MKRKAEIVSNDKSRPKRKVKTIDQQEDEQKVYVVIVDRCSYMDGEYVSSSSDVLMSTTNETYAYDTALKEQLTLFLFENMTNACCGCEKSVEEKEGNPNYFKDDEESMDKNEDGLCVECAFYKDIQYMMNTFDNSRDMFNHFNVEDYIEELAPSQKPDCFRVVVNETCIEADIDTSSCDAVALLTDILGNRFAESKRF